MEIKDITKEAVLISEDASLKDAVAKMITEKTNSLLVTDTNGILIGEVSVADLLEAIMPSYLDGDSIAAHFATSDMFDEAVQDASEKSVTYFMEKELHPVTLNDSPMEVAAKAIEHKRVRIPVVDKENKPIGIISRRGLKHIIGEALNISDAE